MTEGRIVKRCARGHIMKPFWSECEICGSRSDRTPRALDTNPPGPGPTMVGSGELTAPAASGASHALVGMLVLPEHDQIHKIRTGTNTVGSAETNDIILRGRFVSARHAVIGHSQDGGFKVTDLESTNGTFVNGERVRERRIADGDRIRLGNIQVIFKSCV
jgi:hypothetical protein